MVEKIYRFFIRRLRRHLGYARNPRKKGFITDHALLRYLERIDGIDVEGIREKLDSEELRKLSAENDGEGKFTLNGVRFTIAGGYVVSVAKPNPLAPTIKTDKRKVWTF